ncbi:IS1595-like element ISAlis1 family transposase [Alicyclobacillus sp. TC]|uniref:Transposase-like protein n=2 Tax=Alicyclobacillus tolerans TaxID=90970 RepID=A0ABT9LVG8_9BACL|nr:MULTISPECIES: IS1595-like element ISAlis1 family transposase [Alicyclobacillus]MDP9728268.1 transposase-like protein [Alicyclobacillus tengchongensis]QRF23476.1 IS1595-like element ISAlis1 family transposase [Alicyclobacillus sp. TC]SHK94643.1 Transposase [Alicyclobacillus montanus]
MGWKDLYEDFDELSQGEKLALFEAIKDTLFPEPRLKLDKVAEEIRDSRFSSGLACVHCGSKTVKRNGTYRSRQRYLCKDCGKSFNDTTASPIAGTRYPDKWLKFIEYMLEGLTLPKIAMVLHIHVSTAFYWRHKVLYALRSLGHDALNGIVESDETFFLESHKGRKPVTFRKPRKRGGVAKKRGISKEQVCVVVALDRDGDVVAQNAGRGRITATEIDAVLGSRLAPGSLLCTDSAKNYMAFARMKGLHHEVINVRKGVYVRKGIYHVQHVNAYHKRLKKWMERFQGVATKYLDNYLFWFRFLERYKNLSPYEAKRSILRDMSRRSNAVTVEFLRAV